MTDVKQPNKQGAHAQEPIKKAGEVAKDVAEKGRKGGATAVMGAAAGAIAGATIGGLAGAALSDEKTRKTVSQQLGSVAKTATETIKRLDENSDKIKANLKDTASTLKDSAEPMHKTATKRS